ncbi:breast carcinoma-amplified sequence 3 homolog isoform X1 [Tribolium castaneum]|uniref:breast carcinoma-amplified sequence 3 homolog isoform X1 n=1 Tax=Tribolium castaneum TaxID=7070 RepID=UPI00046C3D26|nr:PREDICTED: breast carcinoma-amplified sequence 3 homolog isoform X1 [Tribolium castaneum]XP_015834452.1 PREDICTED: breast carcinoma-amplified sequence 3 homolog isoform X1 [Tribolium castaneum]XP_015834453.1 PREDICTED: breast carcinoma-amplified sequence 3 homolog isoform X1 [Tribolium castaneum]|eukprot:XP_008191608.1 PREDICTED: breast carcinoma-amplified sequence 3 homolog isoform X1 [Tribolium castaneum]
MSAESPRRSRSQTRGGSSVTVAPQQVTDPTILDSVAGFINEVVPTAYNVPNEVDDKIQWAHFEQLDQDEATWGSIYDADNAVPPPLILVLGYTTGIQIWVIPATGEATEILSFRHSILRVLRLIPTPFKTGGDNVDLFASSRPLIALCDSISNYSTLTFRSLKGGVVDPVKQIQFKTSILNVLANRHSIVVSFAEKIAVFDAFTLENRISVTTCYLSPGIQQNPLALGARWLAYAEKRLIANNRSGGGNEGEGVQSYTATVLHAAKSLGRGIREFTESVAGSLTGNPNFKPGSSTSSPQAGGVADVPQKGIVTILDIENKTMSPQENVIPQDAVIAHFVAHTEAIVCLSFDPSGMLLLTADKRGHDFHVFRIQPHPGGPALAAVHHLYVLHRGDTSAKVQDMCFSPDSRWVTVSTLRGTTHVFPVTPYGGPISVRTHATAHVVNKMSRYQRSAGLTLEGRSSSPVSLTETPVNSLFPYRNPRFPPYPQPTIVNPLAQIRQPVYVQNTTGALSQRTHPGRQRLSSSSEENITLRVVACFASPRAWMDVSKGGPRETSHKPQIKPVESLFVISCYGTLIQYDLEPHPSSSLPKERVCNDTPIELKVCAKAQWSLHRRLHTADVPLPLSEDNLNFIAQSVPLYKKTKPDHNDDHWLSQVEIVTHLGPHRRLWMGPQFTFKTYTITNGTVLETKSVDVRRSKPVNMPVSKANAILIESGSASSCEQLFLDTYHKACEEVGSAGETRLKEDLADAMLESPGIRGGDTGGHCVIVSMKPSSTVAKVVNPLGTVVTVQSDDETTLEQQVIEDAVIHENCDEALFRPVVAPKAVFYSETKPKPCPPDHILTKSLEANTEVAVKIINHKSNNEKNNRLSSKHIKSRESSPKTKTIKKSCGKIEENKTKIKKEDKVQDVLDCVCVDLPQFEDVPMKKSPDSSLFESILKFEDAEDCSEKMTNALNKTTDPEITCSSEEEKLSTRKARKPKTKLGVKITKEKENASLVEIDVPPIKRSWNIVAASKPPKEKIIDLDLPEIESVESFAVNKLAKKENLIDIDVEVKNDELLKIDNKSSDEIGSSPDTTESDDSSKVPPIVEDENLAPAQNSQTSKSSRKKSKKKRK